MSNPSATAQDPHADLTQPRLPSHIKPVRYDLALAPNLNDWVFEGYVAIHIDVLEATKFIQLHANELVFHTITLSKGWIPPASRVENAKARSELSRIQTQITHVFDAASQRALITLGETIPAGKYTLEIQYKGELNDHMAGFYRSVHADPNSNISYRCALTQFEATDARLCFPCWDEPAHKAVFGCTLVTEKHHRALSCAPVSLQTIVTVAAGTGLPGAAYTYGFAEPSSVIKPGYVVTEFHDTPIMSTYLLAFVVGEFDYVQRYSKGGVDVRVYTPPGAAAKGMFSLDLACRALDYFAEYFQIPYVMPKLDLVAAADVAANAMENWGLITYRATRLLVDANSTTRADLIALSRTVCHELAHMWFGNLVTMEWWTQLWLNEGFARYMEFKAVNALYPSWRVWDIFVSQVVSLAQNLDKLKSSHPIEVEVNMPEEINAIFDAISYAKGASVLRMLANFMGDSFMEGVRRYLKHYQFSNAISANLWDSLQEAYDAAASAEGASGKDSSRYIVWEGKDSMNIRTIMRTWTTEANFPIVTVKVSNYDEATKTVTFSLTQESIVPDPEDTRLWPVILPVLTPAGDVCTVIFNTKTCEWKYRLPDSVPSLQEALFKFNYEQSGFVHVCYADGIPKPLSDRIAASCNGLALSEGGLSAVDRLGVLADLGVLLSLSKVRVGQFLEALKWYENEEDVCVLETLCSVMRTFYERHAAGKPAYLKELGKYLAARLEPAYSRMGWGENEIVRDPHLDMKRATIISTYARFGASDDLLLKGVTFFEQSLRQHAALFPEIESWDAVPADANGIRLTSALAAILAPNEMKMPIPAKESETDPLEILANRIIESGAVVNPSTAVPYNPQNIQPDFRSPVYSLALSYCFAQARKAGSEDEVKAQNYRFWAALFVIFARLHQMAASHDEANRILRVLCSLPTNITTFPDGRDRSDLLFNYCNSNRVRGQDRMFGYRALDTPCVLKMLMNNWDAFYARMKSGSHALIPAIMSSLLSKFSGYAMAELLSHFFEQHPCPEAASTIAQVVETISDNDHSVQTERYDLAKMFPGSDA